MDYMVYSENIIVAKVQNGALTVIDEKRAPIALLNGTNFEEWVSSRALDGSRTHGRILKKTHGLSSFASDFDTAMKYHAAVITDNFWVKNDSENIVYEDVVFNDDKYFKMAISQDASVIDKKSSKTPELTNIGSQEKGWKLIDNEWWLYKNETLDEVYHEMLTSLIGKDLGFNMAFYDIKDCYIRTKDFTEGKYNLQHADSIMKEHNNSAGVKITDEDWKYNYEQFLKLGNNIAEDYLNILYLDAICNNVDRHTKNYGLLTDRANGDLIGLAPNYDNNMSFYGIEEASKTSNKLTRDFINFIKTNDIDFVPPQSLDKTKIFNLLNEHIRLKYLNFDFLMNYVCENMKLICEELSKERIPSIEDVSEEKSEVLNNSKSLNIEFGK